MGKLIRLELFNFKSYRGHHVLLFGDSYFTSIIGPNGSGKSNSMDAISFVLGIKSSHLRSTHLRDLIYRGRILKTSKINADGTAQEANGDDGTNGDVNGNAEEPQNSQRHDPTTAWVMAVYEDDAGDEQKWKRTITSQGQSEYRINNRQVTAKEYNEALEQENILIKARNFLVFQGDVEAIASQSPKDLTRLVEQISGSLEYKDEYERLLKESDKANDDQQSELQRRRQINGEIKQYSEQKKEADKYSGKQDERDDAVLTHVLWKLYHLQRVIEESGEEIKRHQEELKEYRRGIEKSEQQFEDARKDQAKVGREVSKAERTIKASEKDIQDKQNDLIPIDEKIAISNRNIEKFQKRVAEVSKEKDSQTHNVEQLRKDLGIVQKAQTKWEDDWSKVQNQQGRQLNDNDISEYNRLKADVSKRTATSQIKIDNLTRQRKTDEETVKSLKSKVDEYDKALEKLDAEAGDLAEQISTNDGVIKRTSKDVDAKKKQYHNTNSERLKTEQKRTELDEKMQEVLRKLLEADDGRRQSEKEIRARETVVTLKRLFPGVRGRAHELCKPKQKKFEIAVSVVLGRHIDSIVVDTEKTAKDCISYLREQQMGQATFIPIDTIQVTNINSNFKGMHKNMRLAIDTIDYDNSVERALSYACGNAIVCDDMQTARYLCYEKHVDAKAVTLDGTVIHKGGLMTGGRGPNDRNTRKWDDAEVGNLTRLKDKLMNDMQALPRNQQSVTEEETLQGELSGLEQRLAFAREEAKTLDKNIDSKKRELQFTQRQLNEVRPKYNEQSQSLQNLQSNIEQLRSEVSTVEDKVFAAFCQRLKYDDIRTYEAQQGTLQQEAAQKKLEFTMQKSKLENQLSFETQRLQTTSDRIKAIEDQGKRDRELVTSLEEEKQAMQAELDELDEQLTQVKTHMEAAKQKQTNAAEKVSERRRDLQKRSKDSEFVTKTVSGLEAEVQRNAAGRYALLRKCKIDEIKLPLVEGSSTLQSLPADDLLQGQVDPDAMDVDEDPEATNVEMPPVQDYGIEIDFENLDDDLKEDSSPNQETDLQAIITKLNNDLSSMNPNMRALDRLDAANTRLEAIESTFKAARTAARNAADDLEDVRAKRADLFNKAFSHISEQIKPVYKALTRSAAFPLGGNAYLDTMNADEAAPFDGGLKYHAMPPLKRFRDMEALSGGEKTIAALALLFAVHSYAPSPFFVLDEVDAALDNANVAKVAKYIKEHAGPGMQFIVISLKTALFQESDCLVGIMRDQTVNSSRALTLDLRKYQPV